MSCQTKLMNSGDISDPWKYRQAKIITVNIYRDITVYQELALSLPMGYLIERLIQLHAINIIAIPILQMRKLKSNILKVAKVMDFRAKILNPGVNLRRPVFDQHSKIGKMIILNREMNEGFQSAERRIFMYLYMSMCICLHMNIYPIP